jgi:hypothetical protein
VCEVSFHVLQNVVCSIDVENEVSELALMFVLRSVDGFILSIDVVVSREVWV